ncbi:MAG TPA: F0F1 ATP synthase subunit delta [Microlunatus sp.]|nr:F0F1 ATP synthase subunit delta [Microlunatus sp.]
MSDAGDSRLGVLDRVLDSVVEQSAHRDGLLGRIADAVTGPPEGADLNVVSRDLFSVVEALDGSASLRRILTDPGTPEGARTDFIRGLLQGKVSAAAMEVVVQAVALRWSGGRTLTAALERQAVRAELMQADRDGRLDDTEDELFRLARVVESDSGLRNALGDRAVDRSHREELIGSLLQGRATPATTVLAQRAVGARERSYGHTLEGYINLAAAQKNRVIATVRVARPLTDDQLQRLRSSLARQVGRDVALQVLVEPDLLGGVRVELGTEVIEGTVSGRLAEAHKLFG